MGCSIDYCGGSGSLINEWRHDRRRMSQQMLGNFLFCCRKKRLDNID
jgi:hypothetical protein